MDGLEKDEQSLLHRRQSVPRGMEHGWRLKRRSPLEATLDEKVAEYCSKKPVTIRSYAGLVRDEETTSDLLVYS